MGIAPELEPGDELVDEHQALGTKQTELTTAVDDTVAPPQDNSKGQAGSETRAGMRAMSATTNASVNAENATPARTSSSSRFSASASAGATEMATKSRPMSAPATPALAAKKAVKVSGTIGELVPAQRKAMTLASEMSSKTVWAVFCPFAPFAPEEGVPAPASHNWVPRRLYIRA